MNKLLKSPQFLSGLSVVIALAGAIYIGIGLLRHFDSQVNKPISIQAIGGSLSVAGVNRSIGLDFGEEFALSDGAAQMTWGENTAVAVGNTTATIDQQQIEVATGIVYLSSEASFRIINPQNPAEYLQTANDTSVVIETIPFRITVMSGLVEDLDGNTFSRNWQVELVKGDYAATRFEREQLVTNSVWTQVSGSIAEFNIDEPWLADREAPELISVEPASGTELSTSSIEMLLNIDDPNARVTIDGIDGTVNEDGSFNAQISLAEGVNNIQIVIRDEYGNPNEQTISYNYVRPQPQNPQPTQTNSGTNTNSQAVAACNDNSYRNTLIPLINNHRANNGLTPLAATAALNSAACTQSTYMSALGQLTHTGEGGSSFSQRCAAAGGTCDAENVAFASPSLTAQQTFELWRDSPDHNANMLGNHSLIGVGQSGNYATAVFF